MSNFLTTLEQAPLWLWPVAGALSLVGSVAVVTVALVRMPQDYLTSPETATRSLPSLVLRNIAGVALICCGIILSLPGIPGQGLLTILVGLTLVDLPGKRKWELRLFRRPLVQRTANAVRERWGRPPLHIHAPAAPKDDVPA